MTPLTRRDVLEHQANVPWPKLRQVEQDLLLCRAMAALFNDNFLRSQVAMRGGTLLHKIHLAPPSRYSEDIDLVAIGDRAEGHIKRTISRVLADVLGRPAGSLWGFSVVQTLGVFFGLGLTVVSIQTANLLALIAQHRELWKEGRERDDLKRLFQKNKTLLTTEVSTAEEEFLNSVFVHYETGWRLARWGIVLTPKALAADVRGFFSLPIPHVVWEKRKETRDPAFVRFVGGVKLFL